MTRSLNDVIRQPGVTEAPSLNVFVINGAARFDQSTRLTKIALFANDTSLSSPNSTPSPSSTPPPTLKVDP